ncbi:neutral/alkaline non-lysosomal ceramidase N-terminal domain-containing protein [Marinobacter zhejiangensis]|uniref:Neutral ceramidase n=1 Tax=Marinobacter zhejiangensis TaxID=488535 RepID=A0A1I4NEM7_9GAMM|nr:neutral/alkaline non-lysosomal ceramidase N-terminal domain-containing protein [Marinobacter zhejiangensis]SFM13750.1 Neutral/alkaline non-lysosomal ceramidase, N-terminal [Marinobacter zhejiangensis]
MYLAGWSKQPLPLTPRGYAMHGYGQWHHRARSTRLPLMCRTIVLHHGHQHLVFCCLDLGYITYAIRQGVCDHLTTVLGGDFTPEQLVLTCTHTHSGPGGCSHDGLYNLVTPGYVPDYVEAIVTTTAETILEAWNSAEPTEISLSTGHFENEIPVAWNRSLDAYNENPEIVPRDDLHAHLALDRTMPVLDFQRNGQTHALMSLFGVHATCVSSQQTAFDGDNKGYAARNAESQLEATGIANPVAIFAQGTAGDVSPHYHGPGQARRRKAIHGEAEYQYARRNGEYQSTLALGALGEEATRIESEGLDALLSYIAMPGRKADPAYANGVDDAYTSAPCHGVPFFAGTPVDGPGMPSLLARSAGWLARRLRRKRLNGSADDSDRSYYQQLYQAQGNKDILLEAGRKQVLGHTLDRLPLPGWADPLVAEMKRQARLGALNQSDLVPSVLPLQIVTLGQIAVVCCPGEFTTVAGQRVRDTVSAQLANTGIEQVLLLTYCNDYMGYVTTREEYQRQRYEGGHTVFGQWSLAVFQTEFAELARQLNKAPEQRTYDRETRPTPVPEAELALRSNVPPPGL